MKRRTFTVLFVDEYDKANGVKMTNKQAIAELRDNLQDAFDAGYFSSTNFLITKVENGDKKFWKKWKEALGR